MEECPNTCEQCVYQDIGCSFQVTLLSVFSTYNVINIIDPWDIKISGMARNGTGLSGLYSLFLMDRRPSLATLSFWNPYP